MRVHPKSFKNGLNWKKKALKHTVLLLCSIATTQASASAVSFSQVPDQSVGLGAKIEVPVQVTSGDVAEPALKLSVVPEDLSDEVSDGDILIHPESTIVSLAAGESSQVKIEIETKTSSPSFSGKKFYLQLKNSQGTVVGDTEVILNVSASYVVDVIDAQPSGPTHSVDPKAPYDFDSAPGLSYFRPHNEGLQLIFKNLSSSAMTIHGSGAIKHQMDPMAHGESYLPPLIMPSEGADLPGYYTIHGIYTPDRNAIFNASQIPAASGSNGAK